MRRRGLKLYAAELTAVDGAFSYQVNGFQKRLDGRRVGIAGGVEEYGIGVGSWYDGC